MPQITANKGCQKPKLEICAPGAANLTFSRMKDIASQALEASEKLVKRHGGCANKILLFSEIGLSYSFNIEKEKVLREIEAIRKLLPSDPQCGWRAVVFSVMEMENGVPANSLYVATQKDVLSYRKRSIGRYDDEMLMGLGTVQYNRAVAYWEKVAGSQREAERRFPEIMKGGCNLEFRLGMDIAEPAKYEPNTVSIGPAFGAEAKYIESFALKRHLLVMNDAHHDRGLRVIEGSGRRAKWQKIQVKGDFDIMRIYE
ncbi:Uncharacterised protein [uncultured archaeon]|nr:Uncharacterised protein [uncultured archaeon]